MLKVKLIAHTPQPEKVVAAAAKLCYSSAGVDDLLDGLTPESAALLWKGWPALGTRAPPSTPCSPSPLRVFRARFWRRLRGTASPLTACRASGM